MRDRNGSTQGGGTTGFVVAGGLFFGADHFHRLRCWFGFAVARVVVLLFSRCGGLCCLRLGFFRCGVGCCLLSLTSLRFACLLFGRCRSLFGTGFFFSRQTRLSFRFCLGGCRLSGFGFCGLLLFSLFGLGFCC